MSINILAGAIVLSSTGLMNLQSLACTGRTVASSNATLIDENFQDENGLWYQLYDLYELNELNESNKEKNEAMVLKCKDKGFKEIKIPEIVIDEYGKGDKVTENELLKGYN